MPMIEKRFQTILESVQNNACTILILSFKGMDAAQAKQLAEALKTNSSLQVLHLDNNQLGDEGGQAIADALKTNKFLLRLYLGNNQLGVKSGLAFADALKTNISLKMLFLEGNQLDDACKKVLIDAQTNSRSLRVLCLEGNQLGDDRTNTIVQSLKTQHPHAAAASPAKDHRRYSRLSANRLVHIDTGEPLTGAELAKAIGINKAISQKRRQLALATAAASHAKQNDDGKQMRLLPTVPAIEPGPQSSSSSSSSFKNKLVDSGGSIALGDTTQTAPNDQKKSKRKRKKTDNDTNAEKQNNALHRKNKKMTLIPRALPMQTAFNLFPPATAATTSQLMQNQAVSFLPNYSNPMAALPSYQNPVAAAAATTVGSSLNSYPSYTTNPYYGNSLPNATAATSQLMQNPTVSFLPNYSNPMAALPSYQNPVAAAAAATTVGSSLNSYSSYTTNPYYGNSLPNATAATPQLIQNQTVSFLPNYLNSMAALLNYQNPVTAAAATTVGSSLNYSYPSYTTNPYYGNSLPNVTTATPQLIQNQTVSFLPSYPNPMAALSSYQNPMAAVSTTTVGAAKDVQIMGERTVDPLEMLLKAYLTYS